MEISGRICWLIWVCNHPPCAKARVNALFYAIAGLAYNLSVGVRLLGLEGEEQRMRPVAVAPRVVRCARLCRRARRQVIVRLLAACDERIARLLAAMRRLARC